MRGSARLSSDTPADAPRRGRRPGPRFGPGRSGPMSILLVIESFAGGSGRNVRDLAVALGARGHRIVVAYSPKRASPAYIEALEAAQNVTPVAFSMNRSIGPTDAYALLRLSQIASRHGPFDVIHGHSSKGGVAARLAYAPHTPRVYSPHAFRTMDPTISAPARAIIGTIERTLCRVATSTIVCVSESERIHARAMGMQTRKIAKVRNGIDGPAPGDRDALRAQLAIAPDEVAIGFVGRFSHQKDPLRFIDAIARARAVNPKTRAILIGGDGMEDEVRSALSANGLDDAVALLIDAPGQMWMNAMDVFCMSSRYEAMPYVYIEALFAGLPIVTTNVGGSEETVVHETNGLIVDREDQDALPDAIVRIVSNDEERAAFAAASLKMSKDFAIDAMVDRIIAVYEDVCTRFGE